ncbi:MAG: transcription antitermination factor NusB [Slackia sp.]|nr:transcription antitermination factor NusB [Slackia sp.]
MQGAPARPAMTSPRASSRFGVSDAVVEKDVRPVREEREQRPRREGRPQGDQRRAPRSGGKGFGVKLSPGRAAACAIGRIVRERDAFVSEVTPGVIAKFEGISAEDAAFATKIARGVTATLGTLDEFIDRNLRSPEDIQVDVRDALRVSAYELLFLGKDAYAAVDQGVELVRSIQPKASGLANSVLRKMSVSAKKFPYGNPDLSLQVLARSQAFPLWLAKRLMNEMGLKQATDFMRACNADAPVFIAVNAIKAQDADVVEVFDQAGSLMEPSATVPGCYLVKDARVLRKPEVRALFENGSVCVSDEAAQAVAALACPDEDVEAFLEIGAGRGTKTILMQSNAVRRFGRTIPMVSVDDHAFKGELLSKRAAAYGIQSVRPLTADARKLSEALPEQSFDAVLVDVPCSGVGTLRRHPEIRWRLTAAQIEEMASVEYDLLVEAAKMVKPGGVLTYATCTVFEAENARVIDRFRRTKFGEAFEVEKTVATTLSATGPDAHYAVRLRRMR